MYQAAPGLRDAVTPRAQSVSRIDGRTADDMSGHCDTITRCTECRKLVGATWTGSKWRTYQHADARGEPYCPGGGRLT